MIRYKLHNDIKVLWDGKDGNIKIPSVQRDEHRFVDIIRPHPDFPGCYWVKVYYPNGDVYEGYTPPGLLYAIELHNKEELFDGRFNSDKVTTNSS